MFFQMYKVLTHRFSSNPNNKFFLLREMHQFGVIANILGNTIKRTRIYKNCACAKSANAYGKIHDK